MGKFLTKQLVSFLCFDYIVFRSHFLLIPREQTQEPLPVQTYYVPLPEPDIMESTFKKINSGASGYIRSTISIAVGVSGTVVWYDHHEDGGYETMVTDPTNPLTEVWGDGDKSNGCAPGFPCTTDEDDFLKSGSVIILETNVDITNPSGFDGGDKIRSSYPVAVTRGEYPENPGSLLAGAVEVLDTERW